LRRPIEKAIGTWSRKHRAKWGRRFFGRLLVITVSFLPVFSLEEQEGRLFRPLAFTKTYSMAAAAILAVTIVPILMGFFIRGKILPEKEIRSTGSSLRFITL
jgi:Cu(I)/Ag(I) efflux system membrane protein CusA/SilA